MPAREVRSHRLGDSEQRAWAAGLGLSLSRELRRAFRPVGGGAEPTDATRAAYGADFHRQAERHGLHKVNRRVKLKAANDIGSRDSLGRSSWFCVY